MKRLSLAMYLLAVTLVASHAWGHGFRIDIDNSNKLVLHSDDPNAGPRSIYQVQSLLGPSAFRSNDHPGYDVDSFNGPSGFSGGESIGFDVLGPLWYSNGGVPVHSATGVDMVITPQDFSILGSVTVSGSSQFQNGFLIGEYDGFSLGAYEHQLNYEIDVTGGVPVGAYAVAMRLTGANAANQSYLPSDPFVAVFNNGLSVGGSNPAFPHPKCA